MNKFYEAISKVEMKGVLQNDTRAYFLKKLFEFREDLALKTR
jgi:hypothetical protein